MWISWWWRCEWFCRKSLIDPAHKNRRMEWNDVPSVILGLNILLYKLRQNVLVVYLKLDIALGKFLSSVRVTRTYQKAPQETIKSLIRTPPRFGDAPIRCRCRAISGNVMFPPSSMSRSLRLNTTKGGKQAIRKWNGTTSEEIVVDILKTVDGNLNLHRWCFCLFCIFSCKDYWLFGWVKCHLSIRMNPIEKPSKK